MDKKFVIYWVNGGKSVADRIAFQFEGEIRERGIETRIRYMYGEMVIETPNVIIRFVNDYTKIKGVECDECFGFPKKYEWHVRFKNPGERFEGGLLDYVCEKELMV